MTKTKSKSKRLTALFLAVLTLLTALVPISASAAEITMDLSEAEVSWDFTLTDEEGNAFKAAYGIRAEDNQFGHVVNPNLRSMHDYTAKRPGLEGPKSEWVYGQDYLYCFCIEPGVPLPDSHRYKGSDDPNHGDKYKRLSAAQKDLLSLALAYGYPNRTDVPTSKDANACYAATQLVVWQIALGFRTSPTELNDRSYPVSGYSGTMTEQYTSNPYLKNYYDKILKDMEENDIRPSFTSASSQLAKTFEMEYADGKYSVTLTDTNNVLSKYYVSSNGGVSASISGNKLTLSSSRPITDTVTVKLNRVMPSTAHTTTFLIWSVPDRESKNQDMVSGVPANDDPVPAFLKLKTAAGSAKIVKTSEDGKVEGISFTVTGQGFSQTVKTNSKGEWQIDNLRPGVYTVTEQTENRYEPQESRQVTVVSGQTATVTFNNKLKRGDLTVTKTAEDGLEQGAKFHLFGTSLSGLAVDEYAIVGADGKAYFKDVLIGTGYTLEEVDTPDRYVVPDDQKADIEWKKVTNKSFDNDLKRGDLTVTKTAEDGLEQGMKFHLFGTSLSGLAVDEYAIVGSDGKAYFKDVLIGTGYTLEEVGTPDRYIVPDDQKADIEWKKVTNKSFDNDLKRGDLTVTKTAEDGLQEGLRFHLYGKSYSGLTVDEYATVGADGRAYFTDILIGKDYLLEEVGSPDRYVIPDVQGAVVEWNAVTQKSVDNPLKKWNVTVTKRDSETGRPQGDATLAGAVYGVYQGGELIDRYTTDANGKFTTKYYLCGDDWSLREITPSEGYLLDPTEYHIGAEAKNYTVEYNATPAIGSPEDIIKGKIAIIKHTDDGSTQIETPEVGAAFEVFLKSAGSYEAAKETERDRLICDENGFAETKELPYGVYTVHQVSGWDGRELLPDFDVYVSEDGQVYRYLINNSTFEALVRIVKKDAETGKTIPTAGIGFKVRNRDTGEYIVQHLNYPTPVDIDTFYTDESGMLMLPEPLPYGNYEIIEVQTAYGYVLDGTPVSFVVDGTLATVTVEKHNLPQKGKITVTKTGEVFTSVVQSCDIYQPVYEVKGLPGAVYEITAAEDIFTPDGTLRYAKGTVVDTITTGADGNAVCKALYLGKYEIREITAPYGMILNDDIHTVELTYAGQEIEITETATEFYNERQKVEIDLSKVMEQDKTFGIGNNGEILSVQFGLFAAEDIVAADGTVIPKDGLIETVTCDENGYAVFTTDLPVGAKLYVKEIATDNHYILSDTQYPVEFAYAGQDTATVHITINDGEPIENDILRGDILGYKTDRETGENIAGAVFGLFASDITEYTEDNAILTAVTGEDGVFKFEDIPYGSYVVVELAPADGYLPNTEPHHVHVTTDGEVIEISVVNDKIPEIDTTATTEDEKQTHPNEQLTIEDVMEYKHLIPGKEYTFKGTLMDKATGEPFLVNGQPVTSEDTFIPTEPSGTVSVTFVFDGSGITKNTNIVVFENLYKDGLELTVHADIEDEEQTVTVLVPEIGTQASSDGEKVRHPDEEIVIEDTISFENLIPGKEYTLKGVLMDKATGEAFLVDGQPVMSEVTFISEDFSGTVTVTFVFDGSEITQNTDIVVFESLYKDGIELAVHADIEDEGQTVTILVPEIGTTATVDGEKEVNATEIFTLEDVVEYENLIPGKEYTLKGVLMDKATEKTLLINGEEIRSEVTFIPEAANGSVVVIFTFDSKYIKTDTDIVVFETLYYAERELAVHADIEDEGQTLKIHVPEIGTQATAEGKKEVEAKGGITIEDVISFKNLTPGKKYTVSGVLMNKATGEPFTVNGEEIRSEATFTPETADGEVTVTFTFNADGITKETEVLVFESLYREDVEIAVHADIEDEGQTVTLLPPPPDNPQTGDNSNLGFWIGLGAVALGGLVATIIMGIKRKKDDDDE